ncbi:Hippurate hydrolase [Cyphellophora attinorum]|uniref:Hippurate hydrolase n=1 Tax=Cyphellophora attinorum TaxID=1664694 RepID=A0A0N1NXA7_9EURO|nr:Hippurate hydrolase [Phialophora attinorum]KPI38186.1 Hippurate hydrolase [Phialophora attinorum]
MSKSSFAAVIEQHLPNLAAYRDLYKHFHHNPEISTLETETSARIASELRILNEKHSSPIEIKTNIGGTGLIGIHRNGDGPIVLLRADIDGLPVEEKTGLDYASTKRMMDTHLDQIEKPTMHACGHDFHITALLAAIETLLNAKNSWSGTLIYLFQPAEERGAGARMMLDDGLYTKHGCPIPDVCLGQHVWPHKAGNVFSRSGAMMSAADSYEITIFGRGGHGSMPHLAIDPVVIASHIVVRLQTLVSREVPPDETAVVTVGSLKAGDTVNVIAEEAKLQVNIRSVSEQWRRVLLDGLTRVVRAECDAGRATAPPRIVRLNQYPLTYNDEAVTRRVEHQFTRFFGDRHKLDMQPVLGSEDFPLLGSEVGRPYFFWFFGGHDPRDYDERVRLGTVNDIPMNHNPYFAPCIDPTLRTGVEAMVIAALSFVGKDRAGQQPKL